MSNSKRPHVQTSGCRHMRSASRLFRHFVSGAYRRGQIGNHDQRSWRGPRLRTCEAVGQPPKQNNNSNAYVLHTNIYIDIHYVLILRVCLRIRHRASRPAKGRLEILAAWRLDGSRPARVWEFPRNCHHKYIIYVSRAERLERRLAKVDPQGST